MNKLLCSSLILAMAASAVAQSVVIPNGTATTEGASSTAYAWGRGTSQIRVQYVYDSTHFTSQGITYPILINQLSFRANGAATTAGYTYNNAIVQLSSAAVDYLAPSTTFASNHGGDLATVYTGPVTVASGAGTTPNNYYVTIPCAPFLYDPTLGVDLCVDLAHDGAGPATATGPSHDSASTGSMTSRIYNLTNWQSPTGTIQQNVGIVIDVGHTPASGLYAGFTADVTSGPSPLTVNFTDQTFSSAPGGVTGWAWDFDGDAVIDSTLQNPSFTYTNCGTYNVTLTAVDGTHGPSTLTKTAYITTDSIAANFTSQVIGPLTVLFTDTSNVPATSWAWDLDGDNIVDSTVQSPAWVYANTNPVNVTLTVTRLCSTPSTITKSIVPAQQISQNVAPNNGLSSGASVYFDADITNPAGVAISSLDVFGSVVNVAFTVDMYVKPGTHVGFEGTAAEWTLVGTASGTSASATTLPSSCVFPAPIYLPAGQFGIKLLYNGTGPRYMNVTGPTTVTNGDLSLTVGVSRGSTVANPWAGSNIANRGWSGTMYYGTQNITGLAGFGTFAPGCAGTLGVAKLTGNTPVLGGTLNVSISNLPLNAGIMVTGFSNTTSGFGALPLDLTSFGATGCFGRVSAAANSLVLGAGNTATWNFGVPAAPVFQGVQLFNQMIVLDTGFNALGAVMSDASAMLLGL